MLSVVVALGAVACSPDSTSSPPVYDASGLPEAGLASPADAVAGDAAPSDAGLPQVDAAGASVAVTVLGATPVPSPQHIAVDPTSGEIYVASFAGGYSVLSPTGSLLGTHGKTGAGAVRSGVGIALDSAGHVFVGDYGANAVEEFDATGALVATLDGSKSEVALGRIAGVAVDTAGLVYAADDDNGRIVIFDATGAVVRQISTAVDGGTTLGTTALAFDGTDLWVTEYYDQKVLHFSSSGALLGSYGSPAPGSSGALGTFVQPYAIAYANHVLFVADNGANTVQALLDTGTFASITSSFGDAGAVQPTGVAVAPDGQHLYVSDGAGSRVLVLTLNP